MAEDFWEIVGTTPAEAYDERVFECKINDCFRFRFGGAPVTGKTETCRKCYSLLKGKYNWTKGLERVND